MSAAAWTRLLATWSLGLALACHNGARIDDDTSDEARAAASPDTVESTRQARPKRRTAAGLAHGLVLVTRTQLDTLQITHDGTWTAIPLSHELPASSQIQLGSDGAVHLLTKGAVVRLAGEYEAEEWPLPSPSLAREAVLAAGPKRWLVPRLTPRELLPVGSGGAPLRFDVEAWTTTTHSGGATLIMGGNVVGATVSSDGVLWMQVGTRLWTHGPAADAPWTEYTGLEGPVISFRATARGVVVLSSTALGRVHADGTLEQLLHGAHEPRVLVAGADGSVFIGADGCTLQRLGPSLRERTLVRVSAPCSPTIPPVVDERGRIWSGNAVFEARGDYLGQVRVVGDRLHSVLVVGEGPRLEELEPLVIERPAASDRAASVANAAPADGDETPAPTRGVLWQLAVRRDLDEAKQQRTRLEAGLREAGIEGRALLLRHEGRYLVLAGDFTEVVEAEREFERAKAILGEGGLLRSMDELCSATISLEPHVLACADARASP